MRSYLGFVIAGAVAMLLFGGIVLLSDRIPQVAGEKPNFPERSTTGAAVKDAEHTQPATTVLR